MLELIAIIFVGIALVGGGITTLRKGRIRATKNSVVEGAPAYAIGSLLLLTIPLAFACYFLFGDTLKYLDLGVPSDLLVFCLPLLVCPFLALCIGFTTARRTQPDAKKQSTKRPTEFHMACACGAQVTVTEALAGTSLRCRCGRSICVPSLSELRSAQDL
jgi:hypothetical protein